MNATDGLSTNDPAVFLAAKLGELEAIAKAASQGRWKLVAFDDAEIGDAEFLGFDDKRHVEKWDPQTVLRHIRAHRKILTKYKNASPKAGAASFDVSWGDGIE